MKYHSIPDYSILFAGDIHAGRKVHIKRYIYVDYFYIDLSIFEL